jgi:MFS family permease
MLRQTRGNALADTSKDLGKAPDGKTGFSPVYSYYVVILLLVAYVFSYLDRMVLNLMLDDIRKDLHLSEVEVSYLAGSAFALCYAIFGLPFGRYVDTRGRRTLIAIGVAFWSIATICCGLANNFWKLFVSRMGVGIGEASINPAAYSLIPDYFPPERRGFAMSIFASGPSVGGGLAVLAAGVIVDWAIRTHPVLPFLGALAPWKVAFIAVGAPGLLVALIVYLTVREPERRTAKNDSAHAPSAREVASYIRTHARMFALVFGGYTAVVIAGYAFNVWGPAYFLRLHGMTRTEVGSLYFIAFTIAGTPALLLGGLICDYWQARGKPDAPVRVTLWCAVLQAPFLIFAYLSADKVMAEIAFVTGLFFACLYGGMQGAMVQAISPARMRGSIGAVYLITANLIGLGAAPAITAWMTEHLFGGIMGVGKSLATTTAVTLVIAVALLLPSLKLVRARAAALHGA